MPRRGGNRSFGPDSFEWRDLARTDAVTVGKVETMERCVSVIDLSSVRVRTSNTPVLGATKSFAEP
jgi:hypothetical protein